MATVTNAIAVMKDKDGNVGYIRSLSENDITKIKTYFSDFDALKTEFESFRTGATRIALVDYTSSDNTGDMEEGIIFMVPFDEDDQFIQLNDDYSGGENIAYFERVIKVSGSVVDLGKLYTHPDFDDLATLSGTNSFQGDNSFATAPTLETNEQTASTIGDDEFATGKVVKEVSSAAATAQSTADTAVENAATAQSAAEAAQSTADQAVEAAAAAQTTADQGVSDAAAAQTTADSAVAAAEQAQTTADQGVSDAATAQSAADAAQAAADAAQETADTNASSISTINETLTTIQENITNITENVTEIQGDFLSVTVAESAPASEEDVEENTLYAYPAEDLLG